MDFNHIKNRLIDVSMYFRRNTSIWIYLFIGMILLSYSSLYVYKTYFSSDVSSITNEEKYKEITMNNNVFEMVDNEYNPDSEFYVAKFIIKERNSDSPILAGDTLEVEGVARLNNNELFEMDVNVKQITPTYFVAEIPQLPEDNIELRLDFNLETLSVDEYDVVTDESLYTYISEEEENENLTTVSDEAYEKESLTFEMENVDSQIEKYKDDIEHLNEQIVSMEEQIESNQEEMDTLTESEQMEMDNTIASQYTQIEGYGNEISELESLIEEREDKRRILKNYHEEIQL